jgi:hypothetical protein
MAYNAMNNKKANIHLLISFDFRGCNTANTLVAEIRSRQKADEHHDGKNTIFCGSLATDLKNAYLQYQWGKSMFSA